jgi:chromosome segregation ATPase
MTTARELAERAFTLLQDAFRETESRASELDAELKRQRDPKTKAEERVDVLAHRLENVEAECHRWQHEAARLEEILENERVKIQQFRKKLEVAESGPDRVAKKEVNFWRQRAEQFDAETREYKNKIASLKEELRARADGSFSFAQPTGTESDLVSALEAAREEANSLHRQLDLQAAELTALKTADASDRSAHKIVSNDEQARRQEVADAVRTQLIGVEKALADSQQAHSTLRSEHARLSLELERARQELESARQELLDKRRAVTEAEMAASRAAETLRERDARLVELSATQEKMRSELTSKSERERAMHADLDKVHSELEGVRAELVARTKEVTRLEQAEQSARSGQGQLQTAVAERDRRVQSLTTELEQTRNQQRRLQDELMELRKRIDQSKAEHQASGDSLRKEIAVRNTQIAELQKRDGAIEQELGALRREQQEAREQIAGLEAELKEEKECTANLSEVANERREALTRFEEKVEEANERYEEAKWQLGKAKHFERLVRRRKGLIGALIAALRAKSKANTALKAGLDGLRTFKATAETSHAKLLVRVEQLTAELKEAEETVTKQQSATFLNEELQAAHAKTKTFEDRLNTQAQVIQALEDELKTAKAVQHTRDSVASELEEVRSELAAKNEIIAKLEADTDDQQRKLSKLRGSESETMRLKAIEEKDKSLIDALEREIAQLREALSRQGMRSGSDDAQQGDFSGKLRERDGSITRLMATVKEKDAEIAKLKESVSQWKKKYEFLSTEAPSAYQSVAEK